MNSHHQFTTNDPHHPHPMGSQLQSLSATSSPHHPNTYQMQHHQQSSQQQMQQPMYNLNSLSDVTLPISNSQQLLGRQVILNISDHQVKYVDAYSKHYV